MTNDKTQELNPDALFNDVTKAMQDDDSNKLSELLAQETPEEEQPTKTPPEDDSQPDDTDGKEIDSPQEDDPAGKPKDTDTPEKDKSEEELSPEAKKLAELQEQLEAAKKDNQILRSQAGRVPHIQRRLTELDKKLEALKASPSSQTSTKIKPKLDKLLEGVKDTDPALAEAIAQALGTAIDGIDEESRTRETETLTLLREQEQLEYQQEQVSRLTSMYPNAAQVFASPHWADWKKSQPDHILKLATSDNADAVAMAFDLYAKDMQARYPELANGSAPTAEHSVVDKTETDKAAKLEQERQRKKKSEANLDTSKTAARTKEPTDPDALFKLFSEQIAKEIRG